MQYESFASYLKHAWRRKSLQNSQLTLNSWALQLGFKNSSPLSSIMAGRRPFPKKYLPALIKSLDLKTRESQFVETLIDFDKAKTPEQRQYFLGKLNRTGRSVSFTYTNKYQLLSEPLVTSILELMNTEDFQWDAKWIQRRLAVQRPIKYVEELLERLLSEKLVVCEKGRYFRKERHLSCPSGVKSLAAQEYHSANLQMAQHHLKSTPLEQREFHSYSLSVEMDQLPAIKRKIDEFVKTLLDQIEAPEKQGDEVYQLSLQFFPNTQIKRDQK